MSSVRPENVALAAGEQIACLNRIVHDGQADVKPMLLRKMLWSLGSKPWLATMIGAQPGQTLIGNSTTSLPSFSTSCSR